MRLSDIVECIGPMGSTYRLLASTSQQKVTHTTSRRRWSIHTQIIFNYMICNREDIVFQQFGTLKRRNWYHIDEKNFCIRSSLWLPHQEFEWPLFGYYRKDVLVLVRYAVERASYDMIFTSSGFRKKINFCLNNFRGFSVTITDERNLWRT